MTTKTADHPLRQLLLVSSLLLVAGFLSGCNTMAGLGEDTQAAGQALEREAEPSQSGQTR